MIGVPSEDSLSRAVMALLADAAFVFAEPNEAPVVFGATAIIARLQIEHKAIAELCVCAEPALGEVLAANLLGIESGTKEARAAAADAVGELANILAGTLAVEMFGTDVVAHLGIPQVTSGAPAGPNVVGVCRVDFLTEEGHNLMVSLSVVEKS